MTVPLAIRLVPDFIPLQKMKQIYGYQWVIDNYPSWFTYSTKCEGWVKKHVAVSS